MTLPADLSGRSVLVMGATHPVAASIALALAESGADVAVSSATPDADEAFAVRRLAKRISDLGRRSLAESVDLSSGTNVQIAVRQVAKELGRIDVLVVAADFHLSKPTERLSDAEWSKVLGLNLSGVFYACRAVAREMLRQDAREDGGRGQIIVVTQKPGALDDEQDVAYAAAQAGAAALVRGLKREWAALGITVDVIAVSEAGEDAVQALRLISAIDQAP